MKDYDVIIVGSGLSAFAVARRLSKDLKIAIITKNSLESNSMLAQGGVAAVFSQKDHWKYHEEDTLLAGDGHSNKEVVSWLVEQGPGVLRELIFEGMKFDCDSKGSYLLGKEAAHSRRRILHSGGDATGKNLMSFFSSDLDERIDRINCSYVLALIKSQERCIGVRTVNKQGDVINYYSDHVILATGGCGNLYGHTSNSSTANGEGLSLAYYAGVKLMDLEFVQFHPTILAGCDHSGKLVSEAVRGEGAILVNQDGKRIMEDVHPKIDLAPRDIVAREVYRRKIAGESIYLSVKHVKNFTNKFPTITAICTQHNVDLTEGLIPVRPGAHFHMGGIKVNLAGQTSLPGLYAVGEVACSGIHGANRLASNSLLEGLVMGKALAEWINKQPKLNSSIERKQIRSGDRVFRSSLDEKKLKVLMMSYVGIERSSEKLGYLKNRLEGELQSFQIENLEEYKPEVIPFMHQLTAAYLICLSAFERKESRGAHYCIDYPLKKEEWAGYRIIQWNGKSNENGGKGKDEYNQTEKEAGAVFS